MKSKMSDDITFEIQKEFKELLEYLNDLELLIESSLYELTNNPKREHIEALIDTLDELITRYDEFLTSLISIAGEIRGFSKTGDKILDRVESVKGIANTAKNELEDLKGMIKEGFTNIQYLEDLKREIINRINEKIRYIRDYITSKIKDDLDILAKELEKMERYYEEE